MPKQRGVFALKKALVLFLFLLFTANYSLLATNTLAVHQSKDPQPGTDPAPQPCQNPEIAPDTQLTDNFITDDAGDPPGQAEEGTTNNPDTLKFTVTRNGRMGESPSQPIVKQMNFRVDFSRLQAIFGSTNSNYAEGLAQDKIHAAVNVTALPNGQIQSFYGALQKNTPNVVANALRENYVKYIYEKPEIAESLLEFTDIANSADSGKNVYELVKEYGLPKVPKSTDAQYSQWLSTWGKYWAKIPTAYDEFYIGKLEFRAYLGQRTIEQLKGTDEDHNTNVDRSSAESQAACNNFTLLRTVEFPVPRFFRTSQTNGVLNQMFLPNVAQSENNTLIDITAGNGAAAGIKTSAKSIVQSCFELATNNPISKILKKAIKISMKQTETPRHAFVNTIREIAGTLANALNPIKDVYAANYATSLNTNQTGCGSTGKVSAKLSWNRADDPSGGLPIQDQEMEISLNSNFASSVTQTISLTASQSSKTFTDFFAPNTDYWWRVHTQYFGTWTTNDRVASFTAISCGSSGTNKATGLLPVNQTGCALNADNKQMVSATFTWTPADNPVYVNGTPIYVQAQWLDFSVYNNNWVDGTFQGRDAGIGNGSMTFTAFFAPGTDYFWRINTNYLGAWSPSATATFKTISCGSSGTNKATSLLPVNQTGCALNTTTHTQMVSATFTWTPADNPVIVNGSPLPVLEQWIDFSVYNNNWVDGTYQGKNAGVGNNTFSTTAFFAPNVDYYWRINTSYYPGGAGSWSPSATATFTAISCGSSGTNKATGLLPVNQTGCALNADNKQMVSATFTWTPADNPVIVNGSPLPVLEQWIDFSVYNNNWVDGTYQGKNAGVGNNTFSTTAFFAPNVDYYWRINTSYYPGGAGSWSPSATATFKTISCIEFEIPYIHPWISAPLDEDSCIKTFKEGKSGNAPYCAIYNLKFDPPTGADANPILKVNVIPGECKDPGVDQYRLNDQTNVECNFSFGIDSNQMELDANPSSLKLPTAAQVASGDLGPWDDCTEPDGAGNISCDITINVYPNFRIPFLSQIWNNTLYSDVKETLPTLQQTNRPGWHVWAQKDVVQKFAAKDPLAVELQRMVDACRADPPINHGDLATSGCNDIANWAASTASDAYPEPKDCIYESLLDPPRMVDCLNFTVQGIINDLIKLPGQVNSPPSVGGINTNSTSGGQVLATNSGQKERFIGAVECSKHLTRDIVLKPKVMQNALGVKFGCDLTASTDATNPQTLPDPPTDDPPTDDLPSDDDTPTDGDCGGKYVLDNPLGINFGDPACDFSDSKLYTLLQNLDPANADYWFYTIAACETTGYNPNGYNPISYSGTAWGLFQMGHEAYPAFDIPLQMNTEYDRGDVPWAQQTSNAVNYNGQIGNSFAYWGCAT